MTDQIIYLEEGEIKANYSPQALFGLNVITYRQLGLLLEYDRSFMQKHSIEKYSLANQYPVLMSVSEGKTILLMHQYIILLTTNTGKHH